MILFENQNELFKKAGKHISKILYNRKISIVLVCLFVGREYRYCKKFFKPRLHCSNEETESFQHYKKGDYAEIEKKSKHKLDSYAF